MFERRIETDEGGHLTLDEMARNVTLTRWDGADVLVRLRDGGDDDLIVEETDKGPSLSARVACEVQVPASVTVRVRQVAGNMKARDLVELNAEQVRGNLKLSGIGEAIIAEVYGNLKAANAGSLRLVGTVYGDADLKAVGSADLQNVRGNLSAKALDRFRASRTGGNLQVKEVSGALDADKVGGNALVKGVSGSLTIDQVAGNLTAKDLAGGSRVPRIGGNLKLDGALGRGCTYQFQADGNAVLRLSEDAGAYLSLSAGGKLVSSAILADERRDGQTLAGTLGDGGAEMVVEAKGNVVLGSGKPAIGADLGEEVSRQVEESLRAIDLEAIGRQVSEEMEAAMSRLEVKLESMDWERFGLQTQRAVERAMGRMQQDMDRMVKKAARHQAQVERKAEREVYRREREERRHEGQAPYRSVEEDAEPVEFEPDLDEERLSILRMVEQGQITPEEAEMLLDALR